MRARRGLPALPSLKDNYTEDFTFTTDVAADKIVVFDLDDLQMASSLPLNGDQQPGYHIEKFIFCLAWHGTPNSSVELQRLLRQAQGSSVCFSHSVIVLMTSVLGCAVAITIAILIVYGSRYSKISKLPFSCKNRYQ